MAITRMPIGKFTIPTVLLFYMLSTYICTSKFEEDLENVIAGVPEDFAREKLSELEQMMGEQKESEVQTESKQK